MNPGSLLILIPLILASIILLVLFLLDYNIRLVKESDSQDGISGTNTNVTINDDRYMTDIDSNVNSNSNFALAAQLNSIQSRIDDLQDGTDNNTIDDVHQHTFEPVEIDWDSILNTFPIMASEV